jgi:hypothetical protein
MTYLLSLGCQDSLRKLLKNVTIEHNEEILVVMHNYSLNSKSRSHNTKISEKKMLTDEELKVDFSKNNVIIFNQSSTINGKSVSRGTGIKVTLDGKIEPNFYDEAFASQSIELAEIINSTKLTLGEEFKSFLISCALDSVVREDKDGNKFYASFLHDLKAFFVLQNFYDLMRTEVIIQYKIWEKDGLYFDVPSTLKTNCKYVGKHYLVNIDKLVEYNNQFNNWLKNILHFGELVSRIDGISTDPFLGYKSSDGLIHTDVAQDFDDALVLWIIENLTLPTSKKIPLFVSDEHLIFDKNTNQYIPLRTTAIKENFDNFEIDDYWTTVSYTEGFDMNELTTFNQERFDETAYGPIVSERCVSHYSNFFGIFDRENGTISKKKKDIKNGYEIDQVPYIPEKLGNTNISFSVSDVERTLKGLEFVIVRNACLRGGTPYARKDEAGYKSKDSPYTEIDSMSKLHQFIVINDPNYFRSNCAFFGKGPGKYGVKGSLILCYKLKEIAELWAVKHDIKNPLFGFHEHPNNSLPSLHLHLLNADNKNKVPWEKHFKKTISLNTIIRRLESEYRYENMLEFIIYNWMPIIIVILSIYLFYVL